MALKNLCNIKNIFQNKGLIFNFHFPLQLIKEVTPSQVIKSARVQQIPVPPVSIVISSLYNEQNERILVKTNVQRKVLSTCKVYMKDILEGPLC